MDKKAIQDYYTDDVSYCYGCGRLNDYGLHIQSYWDGDESVCTFKARPYHTAIPGYVYGGLIASIIDCHSTGTAAAAAYKEAGRPMGSNPQLRYVTASLHVNYLRPTPINETLKVKATVREIKGRKITVISSLSAGGLECAQGEVVVVQMPEDWLS